MKLERGVPNWGIGDAASIDERVCRESKCEACGHVGLNYEPWVVREDRRYVAFAVCPKCGAREEF